MRSTKYVVGDLVVYRLSKHTASPGRRAQNVRPERSGDLYTYEVDKFWVVDHVAPSGELTVRTRRHKIRTVRSDDPHLRKATLRERLMLRQRFPERTGENEAA